MFQAIRTYFARPDDAPARKGRGRRLAALFMFEFIVVVAGVLVARLLQERVSDARARRETEEAIERARAEAIRLVLIGDHWHRVGPCLEARVDRIARVAATGGTLDAEQLRGPATWIPITTPWSESTILVARRTHGNQLVDQYADLAVNASVVRAANDALLHNWRSFKLLDPLFGQPSPADRANVRLAAMQARAALRTLMRNADVVKNLTGQMRIHPLPGQKFEVTGLQVDREVDECGLRRSWSP